jgi:hypothetical protein
MEIVSAPAGTASEETSGTKTKISWIEAFVNDLLEPVGRAARAKAADAVRTGRLTRGARPLPASGYRLTQRHGWALEAVTHVLESSAEPMQAIAVHAAVEEMLGEPVVWSTTKNALASNVGGKAPRFERVGRGRYRLREADAA